MTDLKLKLYSVIAIVKPKPAGIVRYQSKMYRGWALAKNPNDAKELSIKVLIASFDPFRPPFITREVITIKDCKLHNDFFAKAD